MSSVASITRRRAIGLALTLFAAFPAIAADRFDDVRQYIRAQLIEQSLPSVSVAVVKDGRIVWEEGFGWADREQRIPASEHTVYSVASTSKPITTTGLMTLVRDGKVDLEKPANDYLGDAKLVARVGDAREATVRRVADHTSGLALHAQFFYEDEAARRPSMDDTILRYGNLVAAPGERYQYSNLNYGVLDYIISRASGISFADYMRKEVFLPLGMTRTSIDIGPGMAPYTAARYGTHGVRLPFYDFDHPGASAVFASAHDMALFGLFHLKSRLPEQRAILSDALIDDMHRQTSGTADDGYGFGFFVQRKSGYRMVSHAGGMGGVSSQMMLFPDHGLAVVVLSNTSTRNGTLGIANRIIRKFLPDWQDQFISEEKPVTPFPVPQALVGTWRGHVHTYTRDLPLDMVFFPSGEVHVKIGDQTPAVMGMTRFKDGHFNGIFDSRIGTPDTERYVYYIIASLQLRGDVLNGALTTASTASSDVIRRGRGGGDLTHWAELRRVP